MELEILLVSTNIEICEEWETAFKSHSEVDVICDRFQNLDEYDCLVSPGNSFGMMDGGMDRHIIEYFGKSLEQKIQTRIKESYSGIQPIGTSFIQETGNTEHPFLAHSPTMVMPESIERTLNVYFATKATLEAVKDYNLQHNDEIKTLLLPAFGGGTGEMNPYSLARQMALAYEHFLDPIHSLNWTEIALLIRDMERLK